MNNSYVRRAFIKFAYIITATMSFGVASASPADTGESVEAVWKAQHISFVYRGYNALYTCRSLENKLKRILLSVGAREGVRLRGYDCDDLSGIARFQVALESPVEATAENIQEITSYDSTQALIARTQGQRLDTPEDVQRFPAVWKTVSFARDRKLRLARGDCELVQQLRQQILPKMSIQIVRDDVHCSSAFGNIGPPRLTVSALVPASIKARVVTAD